MPDSTSEIDKHEFLKYQICLIRCFCNTPPLQHIHTCVWAHTHTVHYSEARYSIELWVQLSYWVLCQIYIIPLSGKPGESTESFVIYVKKRWGNRKKANLETNRNNSLYNLCLWKGPLLIVPKRCIGLIWLFSNSPPEKESHELVWLVEWERIIRIKCVSISRYE